MTNNTQTETYWHKIIFLMLVLVVLSFSTDVRFGLDFSLTSKPNFQLFELVMLLLGLLLLCSVLHVFTFCKITLATEDKFLLLFIVNAFVMAIFAQDPLHSLSRAKDFLVSGFLYWFLRYGPLSNKQMTNLLYLMMYIGFFWSLVGVAQWMGLDSEFGGDIYKLFLAEEALSTKNTLDDIDFIHSSFAHGLYIFPQNFIYYLIIPLFISISFAMKKSFMWPIVAVIFISMVGTLSKTFILLLFIYGIFYGSNRILRSKLVAFIVVVNITFFAALALMFFGDISTFYKIIGTFIWRMEIWDDTIAMLYDKPTILFTGHGTEWLQETYSKANYPNPHNITLYFLIEYGILGFVLFFYFVYLIIRKMKEAFVGSSEVSDHQWNVLFFGFVFFLSMGFVDDILVQTQLGGLFFFIIGVLMKSCDTIATNKSLCVADSNGL